MSARIIELLRKKGVDFLEPSLRALEGTPAAKLKEPTWFMDHIASQAWESAPLFLRVAGRDHIGWDDFVLRIPHAVFGESDPLHLLPDWRQRLLEGPSQSSTASKAIAADPKTELAHHQPSAVGIDLGTTYSVVAYLDDAGRPTTIVNQLGDLLTPSVVFFDDSGPIVGKEAIPAGSLEPDQFIDCAKRDMGKPALRKKIKGESIRPEMISSLILKKLRGDAEQKLGPVRKAVITVPAYFDEPRRQATIDAGRMAGLDVLDIMNEPTAAAIAFGYQEKLLDRSGELTKGKPLQVLVFDLGGGTFDVTIVRIEPQSFRVIATDGDVTLGGKDWDEKLVGLLVEKFKAQTGLDPRKSSESMHELFVTAEQCKKALTERTKTTVIVAHEGKRAKVEVSREEFESATAALLARTRTTTEIVILQAGMKWSEIDRVLLVGGSTRMPQVVAMLEALTGRKPDRSLSPDEAVAHGAALFADLLLTRQGLGRGNAPFEVANVNSHSLGIVAIDRDSKRKINRVLIPKNTTLPHGIKSRFRTYKDNQRTVSVQVLEGESEIPDACTQVGECVIRDLPPNLPAGWPIEVVYKYTEDGRLEVRAELVGHGANVASQFVRDNSLPDDDLLLWAQILEQS